VYQSAPAVDGGHATTGTSVSVRTARRLLQQLIVAGEITLDMEGVERGVRTRAPRRVPLSVTLSLRESQVVNDPQIISAAIAEDDPLDERLRADHDFFRAVARAFARVQTAFLLTGIHPDKPRALANELDELKRLVRRRPEVERDVRNALGAPSLTVTSTVQRLRAAKADLDACRAGLGAARRELTRHGLLDGAFVATHALAILGRLTAAVSSDDTPAAIERLVDELDAEIAVLDNPLVTSLVREARRDAEMSRGQLLGWLRHDRARAEQRARYERAGRCLDDAGFAATVITQPAGMEEVADEGRGEQLFVLLAALRERAVHGAALWQLLVAPPLSVARDLPHVVRYQVYLAQELRGWVDDERAWLECLAPVIWFGSAY
jgi:hypothetical protein